MSPQRERFLLEPRGDRAGRDRFLREQVRGAEQHADLHALLGQPGAQRGDHRRRERVVDAAGEDDVQVVGGLRRDVLGEDFDHRLPTARSSPAGRRARRTPAPRR